VRRSACQCRRCRLTEDLRSAQLDTSLRGKERIDLIQELRADRARTPECPRDVEYENPTELVVQVLWPEKRWVTESVIMNWARDAFANRKIDHKPEDLEDAIVMLNDAGLITTGKKKDRKNPEVRTPRMILSLLDDISKNTDDLGRNYETLIQELRHQGDVTEPELAYFEHQVTQHLQKFMKVARKFVSETSEAKGERR